MLASDVSQPCVDGGAMHPQVCPNNNEGDMENGTDSESTCDKTDSQVDHNNVEVNNGKEDDNEIEDEVFDGNNAQTTTNSIDINTSIEQGINVCTVLPNQEVNGSDLSNDHTYMVNDFPTTTMIDSVDPSQIPGYPGPGIVPNHLLTVDPNTVGSLGQGYLHPAFYPPHSGDYGTVTYATPLQQHPQFSPNSSGSSPQSHQSVSPPVSTPGGGTTNGEHYVMVHVNAGETFSLRVGDQLQHIPGPATVRMVSNNGPPMPMPMQVPPGHLVQQIVDENGILTHVILSPCIGPGPQCMGPPQSLGGSTICSGPSGYCGPNGSPGMYPGQYGPFTSNYGQYSTYNMPPGPMNPCNGPPRSMDERPDKQKARTLSRQNKRPQKENNLNSDYFTNSVNLGRRKGKLNGNARRSDLQGTSSSGEENAVDEEELQAIKTILSAMSVPKVSEVEARSALIQLFPPEIPEDSELQLQPAEFRFKLYLSDMGPKGRYNCVFHGEETEISLQDLKPATKYHVQACTIYDPIQGDLSSPTEFTTEACEPGILKSPTFVSRSRNSISLKWSPGPDNGSKITAFVLEYSKGDVDPSEFTEIYNGNLRHHKLTRLQPSTEYTFRVAALNAIGQSSWSEMVSFSTAGTAPTLPDPPYVTQQSVRGLGLAWTKRPSDDSFTLQMEDETTGHGFIPVFNGSDLSYYVENLRRATAYRFRLAAVNEEGLSKWSEVLEVETLPDRPASPRKFQTRGKLHPTTFNLTWEAPDDDGGSHVVAYRVELSTTTSSQPPTVESWTKVYEGPALDCVCSGQQPGSTVLARISCKSQGGWSEPSSSLLSVSLPSIAPGQCQTPRLTGKAKANALHLTWSCPANTGGSPITNYEVFQTSSEDEPPYPNTPPPSIETSTLEDTDTRTVYKGQNLDCWVAGLRPGRLYRYRVRASNRSGKGKWSDWLEALSGPGLPEAPGQPCVLLRSPHAVLVSWEQPETNGAPITEYRLDWQPKIDQEFALLFVGESVEYEVRNLMPATPYTFRVQASNVAGTSPWSLTASCVTPASCPSQITTFKVTETSSSSASLVWKEPNSHGSPITGYTLDLGERTTAVNLPADAAEFVLDELQPETAYKLRIQAANAIGAGPFSNVVKATTQALPPGPPRLECVQAQAQSLKLKWGDGRNPEIIQYVVEMSRNAENGWQLVYSGPGHTHKVSRLSETTDYFFRISASNEAGEGDFSSVLCFSTTKALPPAVKAPKVSDLNEESCRVEWPGLRPMGQDSIIYALQLLAVNGRDADYRQKSRSVTEVYRGSDTSCHVTGLSPNTEYLVRVCALRLSHEDQSELAGPTSQGVAFTTKGQPGSNSSSDRRTSRGHSAGSRFSYETTRPSLIRRIASPGALWSGPITDHQWAALILIGFLLVACVIAFLVQYFVVSEL